MKQKIFNLKISKKKKIYINNRDAIKSFIEFYNNLSLKGKDSNELKLSDNSSLSDFFIDDDNEIGKSYKRTK